MTTQTAPDPTPADDAPTFAQILSSAEAQVEVVDGVIRRFVVERPLLALAGALAGGILVGRLLSR